MRFQASCPTALAAILLCSCTSDGGSPGDTTEVEEYDFTLDACGFTALSAARVDVSERSDIFHSSVFARIEAELRAGPNPSFHDVFLEEGGCQYFKAAVGFCDPPCEAGETCAANDECVAYPEALSGGTLSIAGLGELIEIDPEDWSAGTYRGPAGLPGQLFAARDPIAATLAGDAFPPVSFGARGVALMDTDLTNSGWELVDGQDAELTWTPGPDPDACVQLVLNGFNAAHGAPLSDIVRCETSDSGSLVLPQAFVEEFPYGSAPDVTEGYDWPLSELTRYTRHTVQTRFGPAELVIRSTTYFQPSHPE